MCPRTAIGAKYYIIFAATNALTIPILWMFYPEVAHLSLEGVDSLFDGPKVLMRRGANSSLSPLVIEEKETGSIEHVETA